MSEPSERAIQALPELKALVEDVLDLSGRVGSTHSIAVGDLLNESGDHAGYMALTYVSTQDEHLQSIRVLVEAGQHRDAWLIARTMMEGGAQLVWAHSNQPQGPDEWFWYGIIEDWRQLEKNRADGQAYDPAEESLVHQYLAQHGEQYYNAKARQKAARGDRLPADPYRYQWNHLSARSMFDKVEGVEIYDEFYRAASGWLHWSPRQMHLAIDGDGEVLRHQIHDPRRAAIALAAGVTSLCESLGVLNDHFHLGIADDLEGIAQRLHLLMNEVMEAAHTSSS